MRTPRLSSSLVLSIAFLLDLLKIAGDLLSAPQLTVVREVTLTIWGAPKLVEISVFGLLLASITYKFCLPLLPRYSDSQKWMAVSAYASLIIGLALVHLSSLGWSFTAILVLYLPSSTGVFYFAVYRFFSDSNTTSQVGNSLKASAVVLAFSILTVVFEMISVLVISVYLIAKLSPRSESSVGKLEEKLYGLTDEVFGNIEGVLLGMLVYIGLIISAIFIIQPHFYRNVPVLVRGDILSASEVTIRQLYFALPIFAMWFFGLFCLLFWIDELSRIATFVQRQMGFEGSEDLPASSSRIPIIFVGGSLAIGLYPGLSLPSEGIFQAYRIDPVDMLFVTTQWVIITICGVGLSIKSNSVLSRVVFGDYITSKRDITSAEPTTALGFFTVQATAFVLIRTYYVDLPFGGWTLFPGSASFLFIVPLLVLVRSRISSQVRNYPGLAVFGCILTMFLLWISVEQFGPSLAAPVLLVIVCFSLGQALVCSPERIRENQKASTTPNSLPEEIQ